MAVRLMWQAAFANEVVEQGRADFVAIAREAQFNLHLRAALEVGHDPQYSQWPESYGWWLARRARTAAAVR